MLKYLQCTIWVYVAATFSYSCISPFLWCSTPALGLLPPYQQSLKSLFKAWLKRKWQKQNPERYHTVHFGLEWGGSSCWHMWFPIQDSQERHPVGLSSPCPIVSQHGFWWVKKHILVYSSPSDWHSRGQMIHIHIYHHKEHQGAHEQRSGWGPGSQALCIQILVLPFYCCVNLRELLNIYCLIPSL